MTEILKFLLKIIAFKTFISFSDKSIKYSRRQWDGLIKAWKLQIHSWNQDKHSYRVDNWDNAQGNRRSPTKRHLFKGGKKSSKIRRQEETPEETPESEKEETEETEPKASDRSFNFSWIDDVEEEEERYNRLKSTRSEDKD